MGERDDSPSRARRPLAAAATSTATPAAHDVQDPGASAAGAQEGGFSRPPFVSGMWKHGDGNVEAVTSAWNCHRHCVAQNRAAKVHPVSEGLGEGVELGPEWVQTPWGAWPSEAGGGCVQDHGLGKGKAESSIESRGQGEGGILGRAILTSGSLVIMAGRSVGLGRASSSYWVL